MATAEIYITLKPTLLDAQGATVLNALHQLKHTEVRNVRIGKYITLEIDDALAGPNLEARLDSMCRELLANPVIENYEVTIVEGPTVAAPPPGATPPAGAVDTIGSTPAPAPPLAPPVAPPVAASAAPAAPLITSRVPASSTVAASTTGGQSVEEVTTPGGLPIVDPFGLDYDTYEGMTTEARLALQENVWQKHGTWIMQQLNERRVAWIVCIGGQVAESGDTLDSYPTDTRLDQLGRANNLVPWVFTRPPT
jgi:phosphoribosylformylglycinamidine synthase